MIADGGYYSIDGVEHLYLNGITPVIPPSRDAVWHDIRSSILTHQALYCLKLINQER